MISFEDPKDNDTVWKGCRPQVVLDELQKMKKPCEERVKISDPSNKAYKKQVGQHGPATNPQSCESIPFAQYM
jgi:hypothetical protein